jgi:hypothetical protein
MFYQLSHSASPLLNIFKAKFKGRMEKYGGDGWEKSHI